MKTGNNDNNTYLSGYGTLITHTIQHDHNTWWDRLVNAHLLN